VVGAVTSCVVSTPAYDVFVVPSDTVYARVRKIALVPAAVTADVPVPERVLLELDSLIERKVEAAGFSVVPAFVYSEIWRRITEEAGGFYDPFTGVLNEERLQAATERLLQEIGDLHAPDAWLYPELWVVEAEVERGFARWDGATEPVSWYLGSPVQALSLVVSLEDTAGTVLYVNGGGIAVLDEWAGWVVPRDADQLFDKPEKLITAVERSLGPLAYQGEPAGR